MMATDLEKLYREQLKALTPDERVRLIALLTRDLTQDSTEEKRPQDLMELHGLGKEIWDGIKELDQFVLTADLPEHGLQVGDIGTVVMVYQEGASYEVEFVALDGKTMAVVSLFAAQVRAIAPGEIARVRTIKPHKSILK